METMLSMSVALLPTLGLALSLSSCADDDVPVIAPPLPVPAVDSDPAWSPDGQLIAFYHTGITEINRETGQVKADPDSQGIWLIRPDGREKHMLMKGGELPTWSPSGEWLAVTYGKGLWKFKANGDSLTQLTFSGSHFFPAWSPKGDLIASSNGDIWLTSATGSGSFYLTSGSGPSWAPDGDSLIFIGPVDSERGIVRYDLAEASAQMIYPLGNSGVTSGPRYSPDGQYIAVGLDYQVWIMDADGANSRELDTETFPSSISWSPDGSKIAYATVEGLWIVNGDGTDPQQITFPPN